MMALYGIPNCDGCRRARRWLESQDIPYEDHDLREETPTTQTLGRWLDEAGPVLINRRSTTWRQMDEQLRDRATNAPVELLREHPTLIKRPVLELSDQLLVGFDEARWAEALQL